MKKVIIIGGGLSGVYLASLLEKKYAVLILEARERLGGRIHSIDAHDMGPSWVWSHQKNILNLISSLGLELFEQYSEGYALYDAPEKIEAFKVPSTNPSARVKGSLSKLIDTIEKRFCNTQTLYNQEVTAINEQKNFVLVSTQKSQFEADYVVSTLAPRLVMNLTLEPALPENLQLQMLQTQTWMGNSAKCVIECTRASWRERSLSGFVFSNIGPLGEIHDACIEGRAALFGFVNADADMSNLQVNVTKQLLRIFDIQADEIVNIHVVDWKEEKYSSVVEDRKPLSSHPQYGINTSAYSKKLFFSSTEFSFEEGGYLEGAIVNANKIALKLL